MTCGAADRACFTALRAALSGRGSGFRNLLVLHGVADTETCFQQEKAHPLQYRLFTRSCHRVQCHIDAPSKCTADISGAPCAGTLDHLSCWCEQLRVREQGLTRVLLHVLDSGSPERLSLALPRALACRRGARRDCRAPGWRAVSANLPLSRSFLLSSADLPRRMGACPSFWPAPRLGQKRFGLTFRPRSPAFVDAVISTM